MVLANGSGFGRVGMSITTIAAASFSVAYSLMASAAPLTLSRVPASSAATSIGKAFGANIYLDKRLDPTTKISLNVLDTANSESLPGAVKSFSASLHADYRKAFLISPAAAGAPDSAFAPTMDVPAKIISLPSETLKVNQALKIISDADGAGIKLSTPLTGVVVFRAYSMTLREAAHELATQTHTLWSPAYLLTPHVDTSSQPGKVGSYNVAGYPVLSPLTDAPPLPALDPAAVAASIYQSAVNRRDASAMSKFQDNADGN